MVQTGSLTRAHIPFRSVNVPGKPGYSPGLQRHHLLPRALLGRRLLTPPKGEEIVLNRRDPALDYSHLDRMAEMLWQATESKL